MVLKKHKYQYIVNTSRYIDVSHTSIYDEGKKLCLKCSLIYIPCYSYTDKKYIHNLIR